MFISSAIAMTMHWGNSSFGHEDILHPSSTVSGRSMFKSQLGTDHGDFLAYLARGVDDEVAALGNEPL
jgi:hypothetical protein